MASKCLEALRSKIDSRGTLFTRLFLNAEIFTLAAKLKALARVPLEVGPRAWLHIEGVNNIFSDQLWLFGLQETWITLYWLYGVVVFGFYHLLPSLPSTSVA